MSNLDEVNEAHFERLRNTDRLYDTGQIGYEEMMRRERAEEKRYDQELDRALVSTMRLRSSLSTTSDERENKR